MKKVGFIFWEVIFNQKIKKQIFYNLFPKFSIEHSCFLGQHGYMGFRYIINEIDKKKYIVEPIFKLEDCNNYDFILCSFDGHRRYFDIRKLFLNIKNKKFQLIIGGAGLLNIIPIYDYIDIAVFGRAEGQINQILEGTVFDNVWRKEDDFFIQKKYVIRQLDYFLDIRYGKNLCLDYIEKSIGCRKKCFFCQYSWEYKYKSKEKNLGYMSGYGTGENMFLELDWGIKGCSHFVSAFDGSTEKTRFIVNKNMTNNQIINKFLERNKVENDNCIKIKIYNIYGFPFEVASDEYYKELDYIFNKVSEKLKKRITVLIKNNHFIPMPLTPMENESVNFDNFKKIECPFGQNNLKVILAYTGTGALDSVKQTILNRLNFDKKELFLNTSVYKFSSIKTIPRELLNLCYKNYNVVSYINRIFNIEKFKKIYLEKSNKC